MDADHAHVPPDPVCHVLHEFRVERRPPGKRDRIDGGSPGGESGQALLVSDGGDAEAVRIGGPLLAPHQRDRPDHRVDRCGAERPGQLAEPEREQFVQVQVVVAHLVLMRSHVAAVARGPDPDPVQLGNLLLQGHGFDQALDPLSYRQRGIAPGSIAGSHLVGLPFLFGHPFTAPVSPPTMRRSARVKNSSAGTIASEVNANTMAVSCEYWVEKSCTPSGRVNDSESLSTNKGNR